jgi:hypothetical protein
MVPDFLLAVIMELHRTITRITITLLGMVPDFLLAATMNLGLRRTITRTTITLLGTVPDFLPAVTMNLGLRLTVTRITVTLHSPNFLLFLLLFLPFLLPLLLLVLHLHHHRTHLPLFRLATTLSFTISSLKFRVLNYKKSMKVDRQLMEALDAKLSHEV